ncbi:MAG: hypothetical protein ACO388_10270 [Saprospiraceae bacterium]
MRLTTFLLFLCFYISVRAQSSQKMGYQTAIRNTEGALVINQEIRLRINILQGNMTGSSIYEENHILTTNSSGLISAEMGTGMTSDDFSSIDWSKGPYFIKREVKLDEDSNYIEDGTSQLLSVPYALYTKTADTLINSPDNSSTNELQQLSTSILGDTVFISKGNYVIIPGVSARNFPSFNNHLNLYGGNSAESAKNLRQTSDGGYVIIGETFSGVSGDISQPNKGYSDIWILKLNADGSKAWDKSLGGSSFDFGYDIYPTPDRGYIVVGGIFGNDTDATDTIYGAQDIWIFKLNDDGSIAWDKTFGGSLFDAISSIQTTSDGGYVAVGTSNSANGNIYDSNKGGADLVVIKLNADGSKAWNKTYGGSGSEQGISIQTTSDNGYIIVGFTESDNIDIEDGNNGGKDVWVLKLNADGSKDWDKTFGGSGDDLANSVQTTSDNGYIITGYTKSNNFDVEDGNNGDKDIWVLKLNADGSKAWDKTFGGSGEDQANSIQTTSDNGYIVTGYTSSDSMDIEDGNNGTIDVWVLKLNADGSKAWDKTFGGTQVETGWSIQKTFHGGYILLATTTSSGGDGDIKDENNGNYDVWVIKLDSEGNISN